MATVETVGGRIDARDMGLTLIHEHFFSGDEAVTAQWPHIRNRLFESVIPTLKEGGMTDRQVETMMIENPARWLGM